MNRRIESLRGHLLEAGILDREGIHHQLASGRHGRKLDFDLIPDGNDLFEETVDVVAERMRELYWNKNYGRIAMLGVANGANRFIDSVYYNLGRGVTGLKTQKDDSEPRRVVLSPEAEQAYAEQNFDWTVVLEDVGTEGTVAATAVEAVRSTGIRKVEVLNIWQRSPSLLKLTAIGAPYRHVIYSPIPSFESDECRRVGYCAQGWELISR
jgi:hypothetical protein